jgi:hypothetical protein
VNTARDLIRRSEAVERFGISKSTLDRWRAAGLIGWSRVDGVVWVDAGDIEDVRRAAYVPRQVMPLSAEQAKANAERGSDDWRRSALWTGTEAAR